MGLPLAPVLAKLFMSHHEKEWLIVTIGSDHLIIHDMLMIFFWFSIRTDDVKRFFSYIHSRHSNVKFTMETKVDKVIVFLNVLMNNLNENFNAATCYKSTYSGLLLNYDSFTSFESFYFVFTK